MSPQVQCSSVFTFAGVFWFSSIKMLTVLFYPLQGGRTPLHSSVMGGRITCMERLLSTPGIDVNIKDDVVSWSIECIQSMRIIIRT